MPFRLDPDDNRCVQVQREDGSWERVEGGCHESEDAAERHLAALRINAEESVSETREIHEVFDPGVAFREAQVDRDQRVVRNVSLLGRQSRNNRTYTRQAMREAADLHEDVGIYLDHPTRSEERERGGVRSVRDLAGRVTRATVESDRVKGDIQALEGNEGDKLLAIAEQMPGVAGFSHRATGKVKAGDDGDIVENIESVAGADVVTDPATVNGLFESIRDEETDMTIEDLDADTLREERPDLVASIREQAEEEADLESLREERDELKQRVDELEAEKAEREHREMVEAQLDEADLPDRVVTETFRETLMEADDEEAVEALVADRKELAQAVRRGGPTSDRRSADDVLEEFDTEPVDGVPDDAVTELFA